ncbi:hypothetical protein BJX76DRAFT_336299 [Aspergillus varians]
MRSSLSRKPSKTELANSSRIRWIGAGITGSRKRSTKVLVVNRAGSRKMDLCKKTSVPWDTNQLY